MREALQRLEIKDLIERVAGRCTMLTEPSVRDIVEVFNVRRVVELEAARLATRRGLATDVFEALQEQLEHLRQIIGMRRRSHIVKASHRCGTRDCRAAARVGLAFELTRRLRLG